MSLVKSILLIILGMTAISCTTEKEVQSLIVKLSSNDSQERNRAAHRLGTLGEDAAKAVPALTATLKDQDWMVRNSAVYALQKVGTPEAVAALEEELPVYLQALQSDNLEERLYATEGIGYFGRFGDKAVPALSQVMVNSEQKAEQYKGNNPELEKFHNWIANQAAFSIQKLKPATSKR